MGESQAQDQLTLLELLESVFSASPKWYNLGLRLGLQTPALDAISTRCKGDPEECLREMLKDWLNGKGTEPSWGELVKALKSTAVGLKTLAKKLQAQYCVLEPVQPKETVNEDAVFEADTEEFSTTAELARPDKSLKKSSSTPTRTLTESTEGSSPRDQDRPEDLSGEISPESKSLVYSASFSDQHSSDSTTTATKPRQAFGCGCGKCSLTSFLEKGCPEPIKTLSNFPYLQTTGLSQGELMILEGRLYNEFQLITKSFSRFNSAVCQSLIDRNKTVKELARVLRDLRAFQPSRPDIPLLRDKFNEIKAAEDIDDVFDILADYVSFFSFHITEHIVESLGTSDDKRLLTEYKKKLEDYCKRNIFECPSYSAPKQGVAELVMKVEEGIEKYNMKHLAELISHVSKVISVSQHTLQLCSVEKGCVQLNFQIPDFVKYYIFPLLEEKIAGLKALGIILVRCDKWKYQLTEKHTSPSHQLPSEASMPHMELTIQPSSASPPIPHKARSRSSPPPPPSQPSTGSPLTAHKAPPTPPLSTSPPIPPIPRKMSWSPPPPRTHSSPPPPSPPIPHKASSSPPIPHKASSSPPIPHKAPGSPPTPHKAPGSPPTPHKAPGSPPTPHKAPGSPSTPHKAPYEPPSESPPPPITPTEDNSGGNAYAMVHIESQADVDKFESIYSHGTITRQESEERLMMVDYDCFLLRESESRPGCLTLSVKQNGEPKHVLIEATEEGYVPHGESEPFRSMQSFVDHVSRHLPPCPVPREDTDSTLKRDQPSTSAKPEPPGWLSDYSSDYTGTGETIADWTGGTGDSGAIMCLAAVPPLPPKHTGPRYERIRSDKLDKEHEYSRVQNPVLTAASKSLTFPLEGRSRAVPVGDPSRPGFPPPGLGVSGGAAKLTPEAKYENLTSK